MWILVRSKKSFPSGYWWSNLIGTLNSYTTVWASSREEGWKYKGG